MCMYENTTMKFNVIKLIGKNKNMFEKGHRPDHLWSNISTSVPSNQIGNGVFNK